MLRQVLCGVALGAAVVCLGGDRLYAQAGQPPVLSAVLSRAATYVETFADRVSGFVTAETYEQDVFLPINRFGGRPGQRGYSGPLHRALKSDLLLVRPVGADGWMQFRDVTEVDGRKLKDRNDRLARLFLEPSKSTATQSHKIMQESARTGAVHDRPDLLMGVEEITDLMGYALINELERQFSLEEDLEKRYGGGDVDVVRRSGH